MGVAILIICLSLIGTFYATAEIVCYIKKGNGNTAE